MGMNVGNSAEGDVMVEVNTTPLIDLMLVLIVMLIITLPPQTHAVKLDNPPPNPPKSDPPPVVDIYIDFDGSIYWNNEKVDQGSVLTSYLEQTATQEPKPEVHIRPNKLVRYDTVAYLLATSQRLGVTNIGIVGNESM